MRNEKIKKNLFSFLIVLLLRLSVIDFCACLLPSSHLIRPENSAFEGFLSICFCGQFYCRFTFNFSSCARDSSVEWLVRGWWNELSWSLGS